MSGRAGDTARFIERVWYEDTPAMRAARALLAPAEWAYAGAVRARGAFYDRGWLRVHESTIPVLSVGNLTAGGTGKTPIAAWIAGELARRGAAPAVVRRGYGDDESRVHRMVNPSIPVLAAADRVAGIRAAAAVGADVAVLDDGFQHRRAGRREDWVLISADAWSAPRRFHPAGAWREPLHALRRATLVIVTRKHVSRAIAEGAQMAVKGAAPDLPVAAVHLSLGELVACAGAPQDPSTMALSALAGANVAAIAGIASPGAFRAQLFDAGAKDVSLFPHPDHYLFSATDAASLARRTANADYVVCTLKDAVKLGTLWPRAGQALWYVSQRIEVDAGADLMAAGLDRLMTNPHADQPSAPKGDPRP